jgi:hypothetical protein
LGLSATVSGNSRVGKPKPRLAAFPFATPPSPDATGSSLRWLGLTDSGDDHQIVKIGLSWAGYQQSVRAFEGVVGVILIQCAP